MVWEGGGFWAKKERKKEKVTKRKKERKNSILYLKSHISISVLCNIRPLLKKMACSLKGLCPRYHALDDKKLCACGKRQALK